MKLTGGLGQVDGDGLTQVEWEARITVTPTCNKMVHRHALSQADPRMTPRVRSAADTMAVININYVLCTCHLTRLMTYFCFRRMAR